MGHPLDASVRARNPNTGAMGTTFVEQEACERDGHVAFRGRYLVESEDLVRCLSCKMPIHPARVTHWLELPPSALDYVP